MRPLPESPLTIAYGGGVDSTAMLVGLVERGIPWQLALMADTGAEKSATYAYLPTINAWIRSKGLPEVQIVRYVPKIAPYTTLEGECAKNATLPSLAFGMKSCSLKWKKEPQDDYKETWSPAIEAWSGGQKIVTAVGLDAGKADSRRACKYWGAVKEKGKVRGLGPEREHIGTRSATGAGTASGASRRSRRPVSRSRRSPRASSVRRCTRRRSRTST